MAALTSNVCVDGQWFGPSYPDAGEPPAGSVASPHAYEEEADEPAPVLKQETDGEPGPLVLSIPPKAGPGSSRAKWATYAEGEGVSVGRDDSREEIIAACEQRGVRTED